MVHEMFISHRVDGKDISEKKLSLITGISRGSLQRHRSEWRF